MSKYNVVLFVNTTHASAKNISQRTCNSHEVGQHEVPAWTETKGKTNQKTSNFI